MSESPHPQKLVWMDTNSIPESDHSVDAISRWTDHREIPRSSSRQPSVDRREKIHLKENNSKINHKRRNRMNSHSCRSSDPTPASVRPRRALWETRTRRLDFSMNTIPPKMHRRRTLAKSGFGSSQDQKARLDTLIIHASRQLNTLPRREVQVAPSTPFQNSCLTILSKCCLVSTLPTCTR